MILACLVGCGDLYGMRKRCKDLYGSKCELQEAAGIFPFYEKIVCKCPREGR